LRCAAAFSPARTACSLSPSNPSRSRTRRVGDKRLPLTCEPLTLGADRLAFDGKFAAKGGQGIALAQQLKSLEQQILALPQQPVHLGGVALWNCAISRRDRSPATGARSARSEGQRGGSRRSFAASAIRSFAFNRRSLSSAHTD
jgi:hypothetical protein